MSRDKLREYSGVHFAILATLFRHTSKLLFFSFDQLAQLCVALIVLSLKSTVFVQTVNLVSCKFAQLVFFGLEFGYLLIHERYLVLHLPHLKIASVAHFLLHVLLLLRRKNGAFDRTKFFALLV